MSSDVLSSPFKGTLKLWNNGKMQDMAEWPGLLPAKSKNEFSIAPLSVDASYLLFGDNVYRCSASIS